MNMGRSEFKESFPENLGRIRKACPVDSTAEDGAFLMIMQTTSENLLAMGYRLQDGILIRWVFRLEEQAQPKKYPQCRTGAEGIFLWTDYS